VRQAGAVALTIDLDATIIASGKRECLHTYRAAEGRVRGERGYRPPVAFRPEIGMVPWLEARDGKVAAAMDNEHALKETLLQLPGDVRRSHTAHRRGGLSGQGDRRLQRPRLPRRGDTAVRDHRADLRRDTLGAVDDGGGAAGGRGLAAGGGAGRDGERCGGAEPAEARYPAA